MGKTPIIILLIRISLYFSVLMWLYIDIGGTVRGFTLLWPPGAPPQIDLNFLEALYRLPDPLSVRQNIDSTGCEMVSTSRTVSLS